MLDRLFEQWEHEIEPGSHPRDQVSREIMNDIMDEEDIEDDIC